MSETNFTQYTSPGPITGAEIVMLAQLNGPKGEGLLPYSSPLSALLGLQIAGTDQLYVDLGATVTRLGDRLFVGAATANPAVTEQNQTPTDWLSSVEAGYNTGAWMTYVAQFASEATHGNIAVLGASRSSDAATAVTDGYLTAVPPSIGLLGIGIHDDTSSPTTTSAWGGYYEIWRLPDVSYTPCFGIEIDAVNLGDIKYTYPYTTNVGGGTSALRIASGGGHNTATTASAGIDFVANPNTFLCGILFGATALANTNGADNGYGAAIVMAAQHGIGWSTPEVVNGEAGSQAGFFIRSQVQQHAQGMRLEANPNALVVSDASGTPVFEIGDLNAGEESPGLLTIQPGYGTFPGLYTASGQDLGLFPGTGQVDIGGPGFPGLALKCTTSDASTRMFLVAEDSGFLVENASGYTVFGIIGYSAEETQPNAITCAVGFGSTPASLNVTAPNSGGNENLLLNPAAGGMIAMTGPVQADAGTEGTAAVPANCTTFGIIEYNGTQYGVPLFPLS